jgi:hypothetical protein
MKNKKKSPLTAKPLRIPGQSIQNEISDFVIDHIATPYLVAAGLVLWAAYEWAITLGFFPRPNPLFISILATIGVIYFVWKLIRGHRKLKALKQGLDGERAVGQFLEDLRRKGYFIFHDVLGEGFNLDHVIIGPKGVFTIETKTISKPAKGNPTIKYDGNIVTIHGFKPERNPIMQAKAQAHWLKEIFFEETGKRVHIKPIIVYPGWFVEEPMGFKPNVEVINPRQLPAFIEKYNNPINDTDIHLFKSTLSRRIRKAH